MDGGDPIRPDQAVDGYDSAIARTMARVDEMLASLRTDAEQEPSAAPAPNHDDPTVLKLAALAQVDAILNAARTEAEKQVQQPVQDETSEPPDFASVIARLNEMQQGLEAEAARLLGPIANGPTPAPAPPETEAPAETEAEAEPEPEPDEPPAPEPTVENPVTAFLPPPVETPPTPLSPTPTPTPTPPPPATDSPIRPFGAARYTRQPLPTAPPAATPETRPGRAVAPPVAVRTRLETTRRRRQVPFVLQLLVGVVVVCLAFVLVQTFGTGFLEHRSQHAAKTALQKGVAVTRPGQALGLLTASRVGIRDVAVIEGIRSADLGRGPGHDPLSAMPGQDGVTVIAGHRVVYGGPFRHVDRFHSGDEITIKTATGLYRYLVVEPNVTLGRTTGTLHAPDAKAIQQAGGIPQQRGRLLVLVTSSPPYRNQHRLATIAVQTGETRIGTGAGSVPTATPTGAKPSLPTFRGEPGELVIALLWLAAAIAMTWIAFWLGRRRIPALIAFVIGTPFVLALLYEACLTGGRLLPQTY